MSRILAALFLSFLGSTIPFSSAATSEPEKPFRVQTIPARPGGAMSGSEFGRRTTGWSGRKRQREALLELERGNIPEFLRTLIPVQLSYHAPGQVDLQATVWVTPDYLAIGGDDDFLYIPLVWEPAMKFARRFGFVLPTPRIVDAIHEQAAVHLEPVPLPPGPKMRSSGYYLHHQAMIDEQRGDVPLGALIAGHKKDLVITNRLQGRSDRVAIYGWHHSNGDPIQPLSTVHGARYADYSHGVRLVWGTVLDNGAWRSYHDVLDDPSLAPVLTYEGAIHGSRQLMNPEAPARQPAKR